MPIYAYKCESCGYAKDALQKMSDAPLTVCPQCGASSFKKQLTAAGFQLKGSGWYVTDFRGGNNGVTASKPTDMQATASADGKSADAGPTAAPASVSTTASAAPAAASVVSSSSKSTGGSASTKSS